jgi:hypothetical protein
MRTTMKSISAKERSFEWREWSGTARILSLPLLMFGLLMASSPGAEILGYLGLAMGVVLVGFRRGTRIELGERRVLYWAGVLWPLWRRTVPIITNSRVCLVEQPEDDYDGKDLMPFAPKVKGRLVLQLQPSRRFEAAVAEGVSPVMPLGFYGQENVSTAREQGASVAAALGVPFEDLT